MSRLPVIKDFTRAEAISEKATKYTILHLGRKHNIVLPNSRIKRIRIGVIEIPDWLWQLKLKEL